MLATSTARVHGHYDFFTGLITLDRFEAADEETIAKALARTPGLDINAETILLRDIRALFKHELTHFLDHVTTTWGIEFLIRRNRLIQAIEKDLDVERPLEVYLLNAAELTMHADLVRTHQPGSLKQCDMVKHALRYDRRHGAVVIVYFYSADELVIEVPLSMLSLLEANAIANEYLSRLDDVQQMETQQRDIATATVERKLEKVLSDLTLSEYSVIITLARLHFDYLDTRQLLRFVGALACFCLDASIQALGTMSNVIRRTFRNGEIGNAVWADLNRGMSRHVLAFKTISLMHNFMCGAAENERQPFRAALAADPYRAIRAFWDRAGMRDVLGPDYEKKVGLKILKENGAATEFLIASESVERNVKWKTNKSLEGCNFDEIACLDILLGDDTVISSPNRIDLDVLEHSYAIAGTYLEAEKRAGDDVGKFHMHPQQAAAMLAMASQAERGHSVYLDN